MLYLFFLVEKSFVMIVCKILVHKNETVKFIKKLFIEKYKKCSMKKLFIFIYNNKLLVNKLIALKKTLKCNLFSFLF